jgi:hypothetical protein
MQLREYIEQVTQNEIDLSSRDKIETGRTKLFDFDYPIFDPDYKKVFESHFIRKFYMREIGFETEGLFKFQLETWLLIHMPYFNKLFESELIEFDPLKNNSVEMNYNKKNDQTRNDIRDTVNNTIANETANSNATQNSIVDGTESKDTTGSQTDDNFNRKLDSDNPDSRLAITTNDGQGVIQYANSIEENNENNTKNTDSHADGTRHSVSNDIATNDVTSDRTIDDTQNDQLNSVINETEDFLQSKTGKIGIQSYSKMVMEFRLSFLRIEKQIFDEMQELFMLVY